MVSQEQQQAEPRNKERKPDIHTNKKNRQTDRETRKERKEGRKEESVNETENDENAENAKLVTVNQSFVDDTAADPFHVSLIWSCRAYPPPASSSAAEEPVSAVE